MMRLTQTAIRPALMCWAVLSLLALAHAADKEKDKKAAEAIVIDVTPEDIIKDFTKDEEAAKKKYNPNAPKGEASGTLVNTDGPAKEIKGNDVIIAPGGKYQIVLRGKKLEGPKDGKVAGVVKGARFLKVDDKSIIFTADVVKLEKIIGGDKDKDKKDKDK